MTGGHLFIFTHVETNEKISFNNWIFNVGICKRTLCPKNVHLLHISGNGIGNGVFYFLDIILWQKTSKRKTLIYIRKFHGETLNRHDPGKSIVCFFIRHLKISKTGVGSIFYLYFWILPLKSPVFELFRWKTYKPTYYHQIWRKKRIILKTGGPWNFAKFSGKPKIRVPL